MSLRKTAGLIVAGAIAVAGLSTAQVSYTLQTFAGSDDAGDGGPANAALLNHLEGVACDARGNVYLADADEHRVRKITPAGIISTVAGTGHAGFSGDGGPASAAQLSTPYGLAVDYAGNLYIADLGNRRVRRVDASGRIITIAGGGVIPGGEADGLSATDAALDSPRNVAVDADGLVYVSDFGANRVYGITPLGLLVHIAGAGLRGFSGDGGGALEAALSSPAGLAIDSLGALYIADAGNGRIRRVFRGIIETFGDTGERGDALRVAPMLPTGLTFDRDDNLFIADAAGAQVLRVTPDLLITAFSQSARDVAIGPGGDLYVVSGPLLYQRFRGGGVAVIAGQDAVSHLGDGGPAPNARFSGPSATARDTAGNIYVADTGNDRIRKIGTDLTVTTVAGGAWSGPTLKAPAGVAVNSAGNLFIADTGNNRVLKMDAAGVATIVAGSGAAGYSGDDGSALAAQLNGPTALAFDSDGNLYIADTNNHAIRKVTPAGVISTVAGTGERGFSGDGGDPAAARLDSPRGIAIGPSGKIFVADAGNGRVRRIVPANAFGPALISSAPSANAVWQGPTGIAADEYGDLFVADGQRVFEIEASGRIMAMAGKGAAGFSGESGAALEMALSDPAGVMVAPGGVLYVCDAGNDRVRTLTPEQAGDVVTPPTDEAALTVANAASLVQGPIAAGEIVSLFGDRIGPAEPVEADLSGGVAPVELGGVRVLMSGHEAPLFYAATGQINAQVPYSMAGRDAAEIQVVADGMPRARAVVQIAASAPGIFTSGSDGQAAALNEDGSLNSRGNPAERGSIVVLFATGEGATDPPGVEGRAASSPAPALALPVTVRIGDYPAEIRYARPAPGLIGVLQVNVRVPGGYAPPGMLPVTLQVGAAVARGNAHVWVK